MMSPMQHRAAAERLIAEGERVVAEIRSVPDHLDATRSGLLEAEFDELVERRRDALGKQAMGIWAQAQVHATLAAAPVSPPLVNVGVES